MIDILPYIFFIDNSKYQIDLIQEKYKKIHTIYIEDKYNYDILGNKNQGKIYGNKYEDYNGKNTYKKFDKVSANYTPVQGFDIEHWNEIEKTIQTINTKRMKIFLFDFDETITVLAGLFIPPKPFCYESYNIKLQHVVEYCLGGKKRLNWIQKIFQKIYDSYGDIYIITNNIAPNLVGGNLPVFIAFLKKIHPNITENHIIRGSIYQNNKRIALENNYNPYFSFANYLEKYQ